MNLNLEKIGGLKCIIEIDETTVTKRKFERGRRVSTLWCVGDVCRVYKSFFFELTKKRDKKTLQTILDKHINSQSHIITDEWRGYWGLNQGFESHKTICHKKYFMNPKDPSIYTQNIECMWKHLKKYVKWFGSNIKNNFEVVILEYKIKRTKKMFFRNSRHCFRSNHAEINLIHTRFLIFNKKRVGL
ncbi:hypothetical protein CDIK_1555 [Cucumispora dikerogammari]|nr:hypothetical protein CDIK_1555 [Cucumispora dikerogammari]